MVRRAALLMALAAATLAPALARAQQIRVSPGQSLQQAVATAKPGDTITVARGSYHGVLAIPSSGITLQGEGSPVLDGDGRGTVVLIVGQGVVLRGFHITDSGKSPYGDDSGVKLMNAGNCTVEDNVIDNVYHGIYLQNASHNTVRGNRITGGAPPGEYEGWGDGLHAWKSSDNLLQDNAVSQFRDGFYLEFADRTFIQGNSSSSNRRYGLHFMFMDDSRFVGNSFRHNQAGTVLMYSRRIRVENNTFSENRGPVGAGVLFRDNSDSTLRHNRITNNTVGLFMDGSNRNRIEDNLLAGNGWGLQLYSSSIGNNVTGNTFYHNDYEVAVDMRGSRNTLDGNFWSGYQGYDLKGSGHGDSPYSPVSMFSFLAMQFPDLYAFSGSPAVRALDFAQKLFPAFSPSTLRDEHPLMHPRRRS
jgi:nitrous oxidase accessory protein